MHLPVVDCVSICLCLLLFLRLSRSFMISKSALVGHCCRFAVKMTKRAVKSDASQSVSSSLSRALEQSMAGAGANVIGMDEAGRGPLAGPVVAAACFLPADASDLPGINDSKLLSEGDRESAFALIESNPAVQYAYCVVSHKEIDEINILQASMRAMSRSTSALLAGMGLLPEDRIHSTAVLKPSLKQLMSSKAKNSSFSHMSIDQFVGLVDGNRVPTDLAIESKFVIQGDRKIYSIAAASIIAKVIRDRLMVELDKQYPVYLFAQHKGYPTALHRSLLMQHGPCEVHRRTYGPVEAAIVKHCPDQLLDKSKDKVKAGKAAKPVKATPKCMKDPSVPALASSQEAENDAPKARGRKRKQEITNHDSTSEKEPQVRRRSPRLSK